MEPVKGGRLVNLDKEAQKLLDDLNNGSNASYALRYAASFEGVIMVLSGMSNLEQMEDNISFMKDFKPLTKEEFQVIEQVKNICRKQKLIACTSCRYCVSECPKKIPIPSLFTCLNSKYNLNAWQANNFYKEIYSSNLGKSNECIECGKCERICPQHLPIRVLLKDVNKNFEE